MKKQIALFFVFLAAVSGCFAAKVSRVKSGTDIELDGYWSDTDVNIVCTDIIKQVVESPRIKKFYERNGRDPLVKIGKIRNESDEIIDTEIVADNLKTAILKSGVLEFMSDDAVRDSLRRELISQSDHANEDKAKAIDNEDAADFMLTGSIKTMVQSDKKRTYRVYFVTVELNDLESHRIIDSFKPSEENQPRKIMPKKR